MVASLCWLSGISYTCTGCFLCELHHVWFWFYTFFMLTVSHSCGGLPVRSVLSSQACKGCQYVNSVHWFLVPYCCRVGQNISLLISLYANVSRHEDECDLQCPRTQKQLFPFSENHAHLKFVEHAYRITQYARVGVVWWYRTILDELSIFFSCYKTT